MRVSVVCLPVIVLTLVVAWPSSTRSQAPTSPAPTSTRRELRVGAPGVVKEVKAPDPHTVQIVLVQPYAPLVTLLAHPGLGIVKTVTGGDGTARLIGTGAYRVVDASAGRLALEAAPGYWAAPPKSERLVFLEIGGDEQAEAELDARTLDVWF